MAHQVLVVFGGGYNDHSLACSMLEMVEHFRSDPLAEVTAWSNLNLEIFLVGGQEMIFGRKEGLGGRRTLLKRKSHENTGMGRQYEVVPECDMKWRVFQWVAEKSALHTPLDKMTIVFCAHGVGGQEPESGNQGGAFAAGTVILGWSRHLSAIEPDELLSEFGGTPASTQINLILLQCFSGEWIERSRFLSTHANLLIHASCGPKEFAYGLRSASNEFRCSLFASSVVEAVSLAPNETVAAYEGNVHRIMGEAINHPTHPTTQHTAVMHLVPDTTSQRKMGEILGFPGMWPNFLESARWMYQAASTWFFPDPPETPPPYDLDVVVVQEVYGKVKGVSLQDEAFWRLMRYYLRGSPTDWLADARKLEGLINFRRNAQAGMVQLAQAWEKEGAIQLSAQGGLKLTSICSDSTRTNLTLLVHHLPELKALSSYEYDPTGELFRFCDPGMWMGNILGQPLSDGAMPSLVHLLGIAARDLGYSVFPSPHGVFQKFELVPGNPGHPNTVHTIDNFLPVNVDQIRNFRVPKTLSLVSESGT